MVLQYSAILACCLALMEQETSVSFCIILLSSINLLVSGYEQNCGGSVKSILTNSVVPTDVTYESTWFSKDRMTGYGEVLNALSAIASITSCGPRKNGSIERSVTDSYLST